MSARIINGRRIRLERAYIWLPSGISMRTWRPTTTTIQRKEKSDIPLYCSASKMANTPLWNAISEGRPSRALFQRNPQKTCQREPSFFLWNNKKKAARLRSIRPITASLGVFSFYLWKKRFASLWYNPDVGQWTWLCTAYVFLPISFQEKDDPFVFSLVNGIWNALAVCIPAKFVQSQGIFFFCRFWRKYLTFYKYRRHGLRDEKWSHKKYVSSAHVHHVKQGMALR